MILILTSDAGKVLASIPVNKIPFFIKTISDLDILIMKRSEALKITVTGATALEPLETK